MRYCDRHPRPAHGLHTGADRLRFGLNLTDMGCGMYEREPEGRCDESLAVSEMRRIIDEAVRGGGGSPPVDVIIELLQGYRQPAASRDEEPYRVIMRALPPGPGKIRYRTALARAAADLLYVLLKAHAGDTEAARQLSSVDRPGQLYFNLFLLCACLNDPKQLADPLSAFAADPAPLDRYLHHQIPLREQLLVALIYNQRDDRHHRLWERLLLGQETSLPGKPHDGFRGVAWMPPAAGQGTQLPFRELAEALRLMIDVCRGPEGGGRHWFRALVEEARLVHGGDVPSDADLLRMADASGWQRWGVENLPSLFEEIDGHTWVWGLAFESIKSEAGEVRTVGERCRGVVVEIEGKLSGFAERTLRKSEKIRRTYPDLSDAGLYGTLMDFLANVEVAEGGVRGDKLQRSRRPFVNDLTEVGRR